MPGRTHNNFTLLHAGAPGCRRHHGVCAGSGTTLPLVYQRYRQFTRPAVPGEPGRSRSTPWRAGRLPATAHAYLSAPRDIPEVRGGPAWDRVETSARRWRVNRQLLGHIKERAYSGRKLAPGPTGRIPAGYYAMWSPGADSYDSRYRDIGWIGRDDIIGFAHRVF